MIEKDQLDFLLCAVAKTESGVRSKIRIVKEFLDQFLVLRSEIHVLLPFTFLLKEFYTCGKATVLQRGGLSSRSKIGHGCRVLRTNGRVFGQKSTRTASRHQDGREQGHGWSVENR